MVAGVIDHTRDPDGKARARLRGLVERRSDPVYRDGLDQRGGRFRKGFCTAALDSFQGYKNAIDDGEFHEDESACRQQAPNFMVRKNYKECCLGSRLCPDRSSSTRNKVHR
jgi:hypothetical protein